MARFSRQLRVESLEGRRLLAGVVGDTVAGATYLEECRAREPDNSVASSVAVFAKNLEGLRAAELKFTYNADEIEVASDSVRIGTAWQHKASVISKVDQLAGTIDVFVFSAKPIAAAEGQLLEVEFEVIDQLANDVVAHIELTQFELNEGKIESFPELMFERKTSVAQEPLPVPRTSSIPVSDNYLAEEPDPFAQVQAREVEHSAAVLPLVDTRVQPRVLATPVVGLEQVPMSLRPAFGFYYGDMDWSAVVDLAKNPRGKGPFGRR